MPIVSFKVQSGKKEAKAQTMRLPEDWKDLSAEDARFALKKLIMTPPEDNYSRYKTLSIIAHRIIKKKAPRQVILSISPDQIYDITRHLEWLNLAPAASPIIPEFRHRRQDYALPSAGFQTGTCREWAMADAAFNDYVDTRSYDKFSEITHILAQPIIKGERLAVLSRKQVKINAKKLQKIGADIKMACMLYFAGCREEMHDTYGDYLFKKIDEAEKAEQEEGAIGADSDKPLFGWYSLFMQVAKSGVFGDFNKVLDTNLHNVLMYVVNEEDIARKANSKKTAIQNKNEY